MRWFRRRREDAERVETWPGPFEERAGEDAGRRRVVVCHPDEALELRRLVEEAGLDDVDVRADPRGVVERGQAFGFEAPPAILSAVELRSFEDAYRAAVEDLGERRSSERSSRGGLERGEAPPERGL